MSDKPDTSIVQTEHGTGSFEFVPGGIVRGAIADGPRQFYQAAQEPKTEQAPAVTATPAAAAPLARKTQPATFERPGDVIRAAKRRVAALKKEIRVLEQRKRELAELENLIAAAKPVAPVRNIDSSRRTG